MVCSHVFTVRRNIASLVAWASYRARACRHQDLAKNLHGVDSFQYPGNYHWMKTSKTKSSAVAKINQRRSKTMTSIAVEAIEEMIANGELMAGDRINESVLAEQLGISRGPIREACSSLERAGLLSSQSNRGMYVRQLTIDEAKELYELRAGVAGLVGELIVKRGTDEQLQELGDLVKEMQKAADAEDAEAYYKLNLKFHDALVLAAGNSALKDTYHRIINQLHLLRRRGLVQAGSLQVSNKEHFDILESLMKRDPDAARDAMKQHVGNGLVRLITSL